MTSGALRVVFACTLGAMLGAILAQSGAAAAGALGVLIGCTISYMIAGE